MDSVIVVKDNCRICGGEDTIDKPLFTPCACQGSAAFVHESCQVNSFQSRRRRSSITGPLLKSCQICGRLFKFDYVYPSVNIFRSYRRRNIILCSISTAINMILTAIILTLPLFFPEWPFKVTSSWIILCGSCLIRYSTITDMIWESRDDNATLGRMVTILNLALPFLFAKLTLDVVMVFHVLQYIITQRLDKDGGMWEMLLVLVVPTCPYVINTLYLHDIVVLRVLIDEYQKYHNPLDYLEGKLQLLNYDSATDTYFQSPSTANLKLFRDCYLQRQANQQYFQRSTRWRRFCPFFQRPGGRYPKRNPNEYIFEDNVDDMGRSTPAVNLAIMI